MNIATSALGYPARNKLNDIQIIDGAAARRINENFDRLFHDAGKRALSLAAYKVNLGTDITGQLALSALAGVPGSTSNFLRQDGVFAPIPSSGGGLPLTTRQAAWSQSDINSARDIGLVSTVGGVGGNIVNANGTFQQLETGATSTNEAHWGTSNQICWHDHNPTVTWAFSTDVLITSLRFWFWLGQNPPTSDSDTAPSGGVDTAVGVRYSTVASDPGWMAVTQQGGGSLTVGNNLGSVAASTVYYIRCDVTGNGTSVKITVTPSGGSATSQTIALSGMTGQPLKQYVSVMTKSNAHRFLNVSHFYNEHDAH